MIVPIVFDVHLPAGIAGPDAMDFDVRCFLVAKGGSLLLIDTGLAGSSAAIASELATLGAVWSDITDVLLTHEHPDHTGGLEEIISLAPAATVWGNAPLTGRPLLDGESVGGLRVVATPGHTAGHVSLLHDDGVLFAGDLVGSVDGHLDRGPAAFTADRAQADLSLRNVLDIGCTRMLFGHGSEIPHPLEGVRQLLA
jgi:glyoxylase-like metal-dependent hydrolase (beta-lactamase superfamily II)